jgi:hypothetical protein
MKREDITIGQMYCNRGAGTTIRKVLGIGPQHRPKSWYGRGCAPDEPGVWYAQYKAGKWVHQDNLYLSAFAAWAGCVVKEVP